MMRRGGAGPLLVGLVLAGVAACTTSPPAGPSSAPSPTESSTSAPTFDWTIADPAAAGFDAAALDRIAADAEGSGASCFLVTRGDEVVGEWYWGAGAVDAPREVFSVTKSVTSTLVGRAQAEGRLDVEDRAAEHIRRWRGGAAADVRVRNLLAGDSGRAWSVGSDYAGLIGARNRTRYAVALPQQQPPGEVWTYNNAAIQTLDGVLRSATGTDTATYAEEALFAPLGMADTRMTGDSSGRSTSMSFGLNSTCRDLARLGLLMARDGVWQGTRLLPEGWVDAATGAPSTDLNAAYGWLWWLNREGTLLGPLDQSGVADLEAPARTGRIAPDAPARLFAAQGFGGQVLLVDPRTDTVVVRLGDPRAGRYTFAEAARVIVEASR